MLDIQCSFAKDQSGCFSQSPRQRGEDNLDWLKRHLPDSGDETILLLLGGVDAVSMRMRLAQAKARQDFTPSHWSHVVLLRNPAKSLGNTSLFEIRLDPAEGFGFPPGTNAVQLSKLKSYQSEEQFPNVAVLRVPVNSRRSVAYAKKFQMQRNTINGVDMLTAWLAYVWGATGITNPLVQEIGVPSAVFIEHVIAAGGFDLTPGLASRASCPEAIWQTAKWWHEFYETVEGEQRERNIRPIAGHWVTSNRLCD